MPTENLYEAFRQARCGKPSRPNVAAFEFNLELPCSRPEIWDAQSEMKAAGGGIAALLEGDL